jgi:nitrogenase subunit NifH
MQRTRYAFLTTDLEVCATFSKMVETELVAEKLDAAQRILEKAEVAYATIRRLYPKLENADERKEIEEKLNQIRWRLDVLDRKLHNPDEPRPIETTSSAS